MAPRGVDGFTGPGTVATIDSILGCIVGGAVGDAMGGPHENRPPPVNPHLGGRWALSDDTQMTLATCESITSLGQVSAGAVARRLAEWFRAGRFSGIGAATYGALNHLAAGGHWATGGAQGEKSAGNGAAMRIAPLAFWCDPAEDSDRVLIRDVCRITHRNEEAYAGALAMVAAIRRVAGGWDPSGGSLLAGVGEQLPDTLVRDRLLALADLSPDADVLAVAAEHGASGYVVESVPLALFVAQRCAASGFGAILERVITPGGDTDTNASMAGQVAGAWLGYSKLPEYLVKRLPDRELVLDGARAFAEAVRDPA